MCLLDRITKEEADAEINEKRRVKMQVWEEKKERGARRKRDEGGEEELSEER